MYSYSSFTLLNKDKILLELQIIAVHLMQSHKNTKDKIMLQFKFNIESQSLVYFKSTGNGS
jgi:hypothetical protein